MVCAGGWVGDGRVCLSWNKTNDKRDSMRVVWYGLCGMVLCGMVLTGLWVKMYYTRMKCGIEG